MKKTTIVQEQEIDWEMEEALSEQERKWKKTLLPLSPIQLLEVFREVIPALPTILAECEESKRSLERQAMQELKRARSKNDPQEHYRTVLSLSVGVGVDIVRAEKQIRSLKNLINLSGAKNREYRKSYIRGERSKQIALETRIETLVGVNVRSSGKNKTCLCPLHREKTPSFTIFPNNRWWCFGCSEGGDSISLVMRMHKLAFPDALSFLTNMNDKTYGK